MNTRNLQCPWHNVDPARVTPSSFVAIVEIPKGGKNKYELIRKRVCCGWTASSTPPRTNPCQLRHDPPTYADDHDPLDVLILCQEPLVPMCMVTCRPIGLMTMVDDNERDEKSSLCLSAIRPWKVIPSYTICRRIIPRRCSISLRYTKPWKAKTVVEGFEGRKAAEQAIARSLEAYKKKFGLEG